MNYKKSSLEKKKKKKKSSLGKKAQPSVSRWTDCVFMCTHMCVMWGEDKRGNGITDLGFPYLLRLGNTQR